MSFDLQTKLTETIAQRDQLAAASEALKLETLESEIAEMRAQLADAQQAAKRETEIASLVEFAAAGRAALTDYEIARDELAKAMTKHLAALTAAKQRMAEARTQFTAGANALCHSALSRLLSLRIDVDESRELESEMAGVLREVEQGGGDLAAVLIADLFLTKTAADRPYKFKSLGALEIFIEQTIAQASPDFLARSAAAEVMTNRAVAAAARPF